MPFDFDEHIDRRGTHSAKWDMLGPFCGIEDDDAIAMWVADMDFRAPPSVTQTLAEEVTRGVHGYYADDSGWRSAITNWMKARHGWEIQPEWLTATAGVLNAIGMILQEFSAPGDSVVMFSPIYPGFTGITKAAGRVPFYSQMNLVQGRYEMDLEALEENLPANASVVLLCSPHNPSGKIWSVEELRALGAFCERHGLLLVSDEIHHDLVFSGARHVPTAIAMPEIADRLITCASATKTFNLAGAHLAETIISDPTLRKRFDGRAAAVGAQHHGLFGMIATEAAYAGGAEWLDALLLYLADNRDHFDKRFAAEIPKARSLSLQSTYLSWVDFSEMGLPPEELRRRCSEVAKVGVNAGTTFGPGGEQFLRFNFALPRAQLDKAIDRLVAAFAE
ncbi:MalY/PatB family protein [Flavimaricola marinus]|uniref:cysteine-S-conjugate beta-lyase n=1 Tax=Flavimaricola marinus TaxID=1819565 RepID=A0A238LIG7_9RHOB|nr:PatB family C-S lyase [Flavimaricola marinus]SMY09441.1 Cystathionine beta-lyase PatB [Flavimaricola marinus]